ncbi:hypothetical protein DF024_32730 [Burkholderia cenocepacia]|nr:hypothetical protein DF024_32730 [Burkholderia cenocepacia]
MASDTASQRPPTPATRAGRPATRVARSAVGDWGWDFSETELDTDTENCWREWCSDAPPAVWPTFI